MIQIKEKSNCCGCTACASICPKDAITMEPDALGFKYPKVDMDKCPCVSRGAVEAAVETARTKDSTWDYGTVLRALVRPATDEEIAQRGILERGDA